MNALIALITGVVSSVVDDWKAKRENQRQVEKAVAENRIRLAQAEQTHNDEWEMRALEGRDNVLRRLSFMIWSAPLMWAAFDAKGAASFFREALGALPDWYVAGYLAISGAVWGIAELKAAGAFKR